MPLSAERIPTKLRVFVLDVETSKPVAGVPLRLTLGLESQNEGEYEVPISVLASDHVGYASFDLPDGEDKQRLYDVVTHIWIDPLLDEARRVDLIGHFDERVNSPLVLPVPVEAKSLPGDHGASGLPSVPNPDVVDWRVSPGSFGVVPKPRSGEGGCEALLPSTAVTHLFQFHEIVREPSLTVGRLLHVEDYGDEFERADFPVIRYRRGSLRRYEMTWHPINHGLGQMLYSLTLAPCESVNLAVIDWTRQETVAREEETALTERLAHDQRRDRTIEEVVEATLQEWQSGESFMGGTAGTGGYGGGGGGQMWGVTGSHSLGYSTASTSGHRDARADTVQHLVDRVGQASSHARQLRSTVVVEATQAERERFETRTVRNHNHCHALSVLYYEVVRHYGVRARLASEQDVIYLEYPLIDFTRENVALHRRVLREGLLDDRFRSAFDLLEDPLEQEMADLDTLKDGRVTRLLVRVTMGSEERSGPQGDALELDRLPYLHLLIMKPDGTIAYQGFDRSDASHFPGSDPFSRSDPTSPTVNTRTFDLSADPSTRGLGLSDFHELGLAFDVAGSPGSEKRFRFTRMEVKAVVEHTRPDGSSQTRLVNLLSASDIPYFMNDTEWWSIPNQRPDIEALYEAQLEKGRRLDALLDHLNAPPHHLHYSSILWLSENPNERASRFDDYVFTLDVDGDGSAEIGRLSDFVDNTPVGIFGRHVAFRVGPVRPAEGSEPPTSERIVALPTRGVFAETKLSSCNACEEIDDSRFWDWQESPCPGEAPSIDGIGPQPRSRLASPEPSAFPTPGVGIEDVPEVPAPVGLREVMELLRTPDIFRDLSGLEELRPLLETLVEVAGDVEKARIAKLDPAYSSEQGSGGGGASGGAGSQSGGGSTGRAPGTASGGSRNQNDARALHGMTRVTEQAVERAREHLSPDEYQELRRNVAQKAVDAYDRATGGAESAQGEGEIARALRDMGFTEVSDRVGSHPGCDSPCPEEPELYHRETHRVDYTQDFSRFHENVARIVGRYTVYRRDGGARALRLSRSSAQRVHRRLVDELFDQEVAVSLVFEWYICRSLNCIQRVDIIDPTPSTDADPLPTPPDPAVAERARDKIVERMRTIPPPEHDERNPFDPLDDPRWTWQYQHIAVLQAFEAAMTSILRGARNDDLTADETSINRLLSCGGHGRSGCRGAVLFWNSLPYEEREAIMNSPELKRDLINRLREMHREQEREYAR